MVVSAIKDMVEMPTSNDMRAYAVGVGSAVLGLSLIRDVYKKNVSQAIGHSYCMFVNWILYNGIYVKQLNELVPQLANTARQYSEKNDRLKASIDAIEKNNAQLINSNVQLEHNISELRKTHEDFKGLSKQDIELRRIQINTLETQLVAVEARVDALKKLEEKLANGVDRLLLHLYKLNERK